MTQDSGLRTNYALLMFPSYNIGDEIQSVAASRFIPRIDEYISREELDSFRPAEPKKFKLILNSWYMHNPEHFPPSEFIDPLLISMHFSPAVRDFMFSRAENVNYLKQHGPVGCRDIDTMNFLLSKGIPAYYSGCLTLTLTENKLVRSAEDRGYVLCVSVPANVVDYVKKNTDKPVYSITKDVNPYVEILDRLVLAKIYLYVYHNASAVITPNLHTTLPCLAFNTPVCLLRQENEDGRFSGLAELANNCTLAEFLAGAYDVNNPPKNPQKFTDLRDALVQTCREFTGYDSGKPTFEDDYRPNPLTMIQMMQHHPEGVKRALWELNGKTLLKAAAVKLWHKIFKPVSISSKIYEHNYYYKYL